MVRKGTEGTRRSSRMPSSETEALRGPRFRQIDEISATEVVLQSLSISKDAFRGFGNPRP